MIETHLKTLAGRLDVQKYSGASDVELAALESSGVTLPPAHAEALKSSNGITVFGGYFRLFGAGSQRAVDAIQWNEPGSWKFAWDGRCDGFWCFGDSAWGDQYAYRLDELGRGKAKVFFLDGLSMTAEEIAPDFEEFFRAEFLRNAERPYDQMTLKARENFGPLGDESLLVYSTSPLLGGEENIANVQKMPRRTAMIFNGDIATQLDSGPDGGAIVGVEPYQDNRQRSRLRLLWKTA